MEKDAVLKEVKNYLDITWEDKGLDAKINGFIMTGVRKLDRLSDQKNEYSEGSQEKSLLFNYCLYAFNGKTNEFDVAYRKDIMEFVLDNEVRKNTNEANPLI